MIHDPMQRLMFQIAQHTNRVGMGDRVGYVHEVQKDKIRVVMGIRPDGSEWLSPWMHTTDHRGGGRERNLYEKGQNVRLSAPGGDYRMSTVTHWAESKSFPAPDQADQINGHTSQHGKVRTSINKPSSNQSGGSQQSGGGGSNVSLGAQSGGSGGGSSGQSGGQGGSDHFHEVWIAESDNPPPQHQPQSGQPIEQTGDFQPVEQQQQAGQQSQSSNSGTAAMKVRVSESGYCTVRVGNDDNGMRLTVHKQGVTMRAGNNSIFVDKDGCWSSKPIQQKKDPIPTDNK